MTDENTSYYAFSASGKYPGGLWIHVGERDFLTSLRRIRETVEPARATPDWADDLLRIARATYLVDKRARRPKGADPWSRKLHLSIHVTDADRWRGKPNAMLEKMLRAMTSDEWHLSVTGGAAPIDVKPRLMEVASVDEVALFSGGLDSTAYAAERANRSALPVLLIGHDLADGHIPQKALMESIKRLDGGRRLVRYRPVGDQPRRTQRPEPSTRSRGFLFAATAIYAAASYGSTKVSMPENGQLAINPPLTAARRAACSTRSVHPWVLAELNRLVAAVGGDVVVHNPFLYKTKGEVCAIARDNGLSPDELARTVSCGSYSALRQNGNCGYCFPCLARRSGLQAALGNDPTSYNHDLTELATPKTVRNVLDLRHWLRHEFGARQLIADMPLPRAVASSTLLDMLNRGRAEFKRMLIAHGHWLPDSETGLDDPSDRTAHSSA
jgi:hypothetical protein